MTLTEFIRARIADDEAAARVRDEKGFAAAAPDRSKTPFDPERILRECAAKRAVLKTYRLQIDRVRADPECAPGAEQPLVLVLKSLALPFAGHPDYRPEWSPIHSN